MRLVRLLPVLALFAGGLVVQAEEEGLPDFDKMWDYGKPAETEKRFRALLPRAEASGDRSYLLQLRTQIARTLGLQRKFEEAHVLLDGVEKDLDEQVPVARVRYLLERGRTFNSSGHPEKARPLFEQAWKVAKAAEADSHAVDAAHMLAIVSEPEEQVLWAETAIALAEASEDPRAKGWLGPLYNNLGWTYFELASYEKALAVHQKGWAWRKEQGQPVPTRIAKWAVARMLRAVGREDEALSMQRELLAEWAEAGGEDGFVHEEIAEILLARGRKDEARPHFEKAWALLKGEKWLEESEPERYERLRRLAGADDDAE